MFQGMMGGHMGQQTHLSSQQQQQQVNPSNNYIQQPNQQQVCIYFIFSKAMLKVPKSKS